jgi:hypothetical protein
LRQEANFCSWRSNDVVWPKAAGQTITMAKLGVNEAGKRQADA